MLSKKIRTALNFARRCHAGQERAHGTPYDFHPEEVAALVVFRYQLDSEDAACAALLHDVVEDCQISADELSRRFGRNVADMVAALSRDKERPYADFIRSIANCPVEVILIKGADMLSNLRDSAFAGEKKRQRVIAHSRDHVLPLLRERLGPEHLLVRDLEMLLKAMKEPA